MTACYAWPAENFIARRLYHLSTTDVSGSWFDTSWFKRPVFPALSSVETSGMSPDWALPLVPCRWKGGTLFIMNGTESMFSPIKGTVNPTPSPTLVQSQKIQTPKRTE